MMRAIVARTVLWSCLPLLAACGSCEEPDDRVIRLEESTEPRLVEVLLTEPPEEGGQPALLSAPRPELGRVIRHLHEVAERDRIRGMLLRLGPLSGAWSRARDLIGALQEVRDADKPVHCHFDVADNVSMLVLASACDRISATPAGRVELVGPAAQVFYARNLLEQVGVKAELMQIGRYKGAADPFTRQEMPDETRESLGSILDTFHGALVDALVEQRGLSRDEARQVIDGGPYDPHRARELGLLDDVGFDDEAREHVRQATDVSKFHQVDLLPEAESMGIGDLLSALTGEPSSPEPSGPRLGLVLLEGTIVDAERKGMSGLRSGPLVRTLRRMADDDEIKAVVLRIHSPGGSAMASDRIWHAVRRLAERKPVIASIGDMAASGGYYVASAADRILAHDESLVGSIGVVGGKVLLRDLTDKVGVNVVVLERGKHAAWMSPFEPMTDSERKILGRMLHTTYRRFIERVAEGRSMPKDEVRAAAEGRLMSGGRARDLGLVDAAGGFEAALAWAREQGELPDDSAIERWPRRKTILDTLAEAMGGDREDTAAALLSESGTLAAPLAEAAILPRLLGRERVAVALPFVVRIR